MENKYKNLRVTYEEELNKYSKMREDIMGMKLNNSNEISELRHSLRQKEGELEELKHKHYVITQEKINELIKEKTDLRDTFEESIRKLRNAHDQDVVELKDKISQQKNITYDILEDIRKTRVENDERLNELVKEIETLQEALKSGRRLNDLHIEDNSRLKTELNGLKKENDMLCKEIAMLESESNKLRVDNDELRHNLIKLDKLVYGVVNSNNRNSNSRGESRKGNR